MSGGSQLPLICICSPPPRSNQGGLQRLHELMGGQSFGNRSPPHPLHQLGWRWEIFLPVSSSLPGCLEVLCAPGMPELNGSLCRVRGQQEAESRAGGADGPMIFGNSFG